MLRELCSALLAPGEHLHAHNIRRHHSTHVEGPRALGATDVSSGGGHRWAGWSLRPAFVGGTRTETILRSLPAQSMMWRQGGCATWEPTWQPIQPYRRSMCVKWQTVSDITTDPPLPPPGPPRPAHDRSAAPGTPAPPAAAGHAKRRRRASTTTGIATTTAPPTPPAAPEHAPSQPQSPQPPIPPPKRRRRGADAADTSSRVPPQRHQPPPDAVANIPPKRRRRGQPIPRPGRSAPGATD